MPPRTWSAASARSAGSDRWLDRNGMRIRSVGPAQFVAATAGLLTAALLFVLSANGGESSHRAMSRFELAAGIVLGAILIFPRSSRRGRDASIAVLAWSLTAALCFLGITVLRDADVRAPGQAATLGFGVALIVAAYCSAIVRLAELLRDPRDATLAVMLTLAVLGAAPVWLGPYADLRAESRWIVNAVIWVSPLTYLGTLADVDYLRSDWFYRHTPFGGLRFSYPAPLVQTVIYAAFVVLLLLGRKRRAPWWTDRRSQARDFVIPQQQETI